MTSEVKKQHATVKDIQISRISQTKSNQIQMAIMFMKIWKLYQMCDIYCPFFQSVKDIKLKDQLLSFNIFFFHTKHYSFYC